MRETLKDFYRRALATLPDKRVRKVVRRLCENYLISPEGRRLSLEENEIRRQLRLSSETLRQLVSNRLLRSDNCADSTYYELSHDALITPVLATRQTRGLLFGSLGLLAGGISLLFALFLLGGFVYGTVQAIGKSYFSYFGYDTAPSWTSDALELDAWLLALVVFFPMLFGLFALSKMILAGGLRTIRRYVRRKQPELIEPVMATTKDLLFGWSAVVVGCLYLSVSVVVQAVIIILLASYWLGGHPRLFGHDFRAAWHLFYEHGPALDTGMYLVGVLAVLLFAIDIVRWGYRRLRPSRRPTGVEQPIAVQKRSKDLLYGWLRIVGGAIALLAAMFLGIEIVVNAECTYYSQGHLPDWVPAHSWSLSDPFEDCDTKYKEGLGFGGALSVIFNLIFGLGVLAFAINWILRGVRAARGFLGRGSGSESIGTELS